MADPSPSAGERIVLGTVAALLLGPSMFVVAKWAMLTLAEARGPGGVGANGFIAIVVTASAAAVFVGLTVFRRIAGASVGEPREARGFQVVPSVSPILSVVANATMSTTAPPTLVLPPALYKQIEAEAEAGYPNEICGMIFGRDVADATAAAGGPGGPARRVADRLVVGTNAFAADEQYHRFSIDPKEQMRAERAAEADGLTLLGYYHSHPDHPARPSEYDREHAWETYSYVIVAVAKGSATDMTSWVLDPASRQFLAQPIARA